MTYLRKILQLPYMWCSAGAGGGYCLLINRFPSFSIKLKDLMNLGIILMVFGFILAGPGRMEMATFSIPIFSF